MRHLAEIGVRPDIVETAPYREHGVKLSPTTLDQREPTLERAKSFRRDVEGLNDIYKLSRLGGVPETILFVAARQSDFPPRRGPGKHSIPNAAARIRQVESSSDEVSPSGSGVGEKSKRHMWNSSNTVSSKP